MAEVLQFLIDHGYTVIFVWVALDQAGLPLPTLPLLLAGGALAGMGVLSLPVILLVCVLATVPIDLFWFWLGRLRGVRVLHLLCIQTIAFVIPRHFSKSWGRFLWCWQNSYRACRRWPLQCRV